jgi:hypothetical protein
MSVSEEPEILLGNPNTGPVDIFVSFSSQDKKAIKPIVDELRQRGLKVWWSDDLTEGRWDTQIRDSLYSSRRVIAFVTEAAESSTRDYIFSEMEIARSQNKLLPIVVGAKPKSLALLGVIALLESYFFTDLHTAIETTAFEKLVETCGGRSKVLMSSTAPDAQPIDRIDDWYSRVEQRHSRTDRLRAFSLAFAVALFEGAPLAYVEDIGNRLALRLTEPIKTDSAETSEAFPERSRPLLELLECKRTEELHPVLGVTETTVCFQDRDRAATYMQFAWEEFGRQRDQIADWWKVIAEQDPVEGRMRLGFALGVLAQKHFIDLFNGVLREWLLSDSNGCRQVADIAISVAAFDAATNAAIKSIIENWSEHGANKELIVAIRLACGFVGTRLPNVAIDTLRVAADRAYRMDDLDLLGTMEDALNNLIKAHLENPDNSLFDLPGLILRIAEWVATDTGAAEEKENVIEQNAYPMALFLLILMRVPLQRSGRARGRLSLESLVADEATAEATAKVFVMALRRHRLGMLECRNMAKSILREWLRQKASGKNSGNDSQDDPLLMFLRSLVALAPSDNEYDMLAYMCEGVYTPEELRNF